MGEPGRMARFRLADYLKKTVAEIEAMDWDEFEDWFAFLAIKNKEHK